MTGPRMLPMKVSVSHGLHNIPPVPHNDRLVQPEVSSPRALAKSPFAKGCLRRGCSVNPSLLITSLGKNLSSVRLLGEGTEEMDVPGPERRLAAVLAAIAKRAARCNARTAFLLR